MTTAIIAGLPRSVAKRVEALLRSDVSSGLVNKSPRTLRSGWEIQFFNSDNHEIGIHRRQVPYLANFVAEHGGGPVLGISTLAKLDRHYVRDAIRPYFRFLWLRNEMLSLISGMRDEFLMRLNHSLFSEEVWLERIKPKNTSSPLLLLEFCFVSSHPHSQLWNQALEYGDPERTVATEQAISEFTVAYEAIRKGFVDAHRTAATGQPARWIDLKQKLFDGNGARHGGAPFPRRWKYSFELPNGFHWDVTTADGSKFALLDSTGTLYNIPTGKHCNVDSHGYVI